MTRVLSTGLNQWPCTVPVDWARGMANNSIELQEVSPMVGEQNTSPPIGGPSALDLLSTSPTPNIGVGREWRSRCDRPLKLEMTCKHGIRNVKAIPCKSWSCRHCGEVKRKEFIWKLTVGQTCLDRPVFITTTWHSADVRTHDAEYVRRCQEKFVRWVSQQTGQKIQYAWVREATKANQLHIHWVMSPWIDNDLQRMEWHRKESSSRRVSLEKSREFYPPAVRWGEITENTSSELDEYGMEKIRSFVVFAEDVRNPAGMGAYLAKYLAKGMKGTPWYGRRYGFSKGWPRWRDNTAMVGAVENRYEYKGPAIQQELDAECCEDCDRLVPFLWTEVERGDGTRYVRFGKSDLDQRGISASFERVRGADRARRAAVARAQVGRISGR